jgi:hypothetical protein
VTLVEKQDGLLCPGELADDVKTLRKELEAERVEAHRVKLKKLSELAMPAMRLCLKIRREPQAG